MSNEVKLFDEIIMLFKFSIYIPLFFYACNVIKEHNTLMRLPWSYTCDECLDKEELKINDENKSS